jgi:thiamine-phosphate pyrophosphorylase
MVGAVPESPASRASRARLARQVIRGLYAITPEESDTAALADKLSQALEAGVRLVQYRNKLGTPGVRLQQADALLRLCRRAGASFIVNDDLQLAHALNADGVHLGRDDPQLASARALLGPGKLIGASCYNSIELALSARKGGADYVAFGAAFASGTKPGAVQAPLSIYAEAKTALDVPVVAIGGITPQNLPKLLDVGVDALAVIAALFGAGDVAARAREFQHSMDRQAARPGAQ